ncbi:MAG: GAF domain-containing sensor histidine kinase [Burkholderiaceae bacterium]
MIEPALPPDESARQAELDRYAIVGSEPEANFDDITSLMAYVADVPIALIALLDGDRNWMKSHHGIDLAESPRSISFCGHAINSAGPMLVVPDARLDPRFHDNPLVTDLGAIFYAGVPLVSSRGFKLGTLCLYDRRPRELAEPVRKALLDMARQVEALLELRYRNQVLARTSEALAQRNDELAQFARDVAHDLKTPIANIVNTAQVIELRQAQADDSSDALQRLQESTRAMARYLDELLDAYTAGQLASHEVVPVPVDELIDSLRQLVGSGGPLEISVETRIDQVRVHRGILMQILVNLVTNAIKYCDQPTVRVGISIERHPLAYEFRVTDNGRGIEAKLLPTVFDRFSSALQGDRHGRAGTGIGLSIVQRLVRRVGGEVSVSSDPGVGSEFRFTMPVKAPPAAVGRSAASC